MSRPIVFGVPTLSGFDRAVALCRQVATANPDVVETIIVDNGRHTQRPFPWPPALSIRTPRWNLGVAASWNVILEAGAAHDAITIIANDDITFGPGAIQRYVELVSAIGVQTHHLIVGPAQHVFSFFALDARRALEQVGWFDEQFYPAYWEDNDYEHRMRLAGLGLLHVPHSALDFTHDGSRTTRDADPELRAWLRRSYERCRTLYRAKWGGNPPNGELFEKPYDASTLRLTGVR